VQRRYIVVLAAVALACARPGLAKQRPLVTEDPEPIGAGRVLVETGIDFAHDQTYPVSGLKGNLWRVPSIGISIGISSIAEFQIDGGFFDRLSINERRAAPLSSELTVTGDTTHDAQDVVVATKIRVVPEHGLWPGVGLRFATKLPNASNESGLGTDTFDFMTTLLAGKTVQSVRVVGNIGFGIFADPTRGDRQNDLLLYGLSFSRAFTARADMVGEVNGRVSTRSGDAFPGTESRGLLKLGGRYTQGAIRVDGGISIGLTSIDPPVGITAGVTYVFDAFKVP